MPALFSRASRSASLTTSIATILPRFAWEALTVEEQRTIYADYTAFNQTAGLTIGVPLGLPADATTVRVSNGTTLTAKGPYPDDPLGGYGLLEADCLEAAVAVAARIPAARLGGAVEVRPAAKYW